SAGRAATTGRTGAVFNLQPPGCRGSRLGQGCSAQSCWVEIAPWREELPPITAFDPPKFIEV
ncbi:hypothetical protein AAGL37_24505, partial [Klebsiella pneumoniae]